MSERPGALRRTTTDDMPALNVKTEPANEIDAALEWHGGDARATIETLLLDCAHLRAQLALTSRCLSRGLTRGWLPEVDRAVDVSVNAE
ncbi:hypothetical protein HB774_01825 [Rhizobium leguminosarum bv. viciae]|nr:hypothetical protein HB774_01825 [Rhizobium leguminosarum bv. viciae]